MNSAFTIAPVEEKHFQDVLSLNHALVHYLSPLDMNSLHKLHQISDFFYVVKDAEKVIAFILTLREGKPYNNVNYAWFAKRYTQFLYIDRIVVSPDYHHAGIGHALYERIFADCKRAGVRTITAEIDSCPPNPASLKFHKKFGFSEMGTQKLPYANKEVSLQVAQLMLDEYTGAMQ